MTWNAQQEHIAANMRKIRRRLETRFAFQDYDLKKILHGRAKRAREHERKTTRQKARDGARSHRNTRRREVSRALYRRRGTHYNEDLKFQKRNRRGRLHNSFRAKYQWLSKEDANKILYDQCSNAYHSPEETDDETDPTGKKFIKVIDLPWRSRKVV